MFLILPFQNGQDYCNNPFLLQNLKVLIAENMSLTLKVLKVASLQGVTSGILGKGCISSRNLRQ